MAFGEQAFRQKHRRKRAGRLLSNAHFQREAPFIYAMICRLFATRKSGQ